MGQRNKEQRLHFSGIWHIPWLQKSMPGTSPSTHTVSPGPTDAVAGALS